MSGVDIKRVQSRLLKMGIEITTILEKHSIPYMLSFGTLLGAVRHEGFIPWDDDFDLIIFEDKYDEAIEYLRNELPSNLFLEDDKSEPLYFHGWAHVKDKGTQAYSDAFPHDNLYKHKGLSVDLYKSYKVKKSNLYEFLNVENEKYIERRKSKGTISDEEYEKRINNLSRERGKSNPFKNEDELVYALFTNHERKYMDVVDVTPQKKYSFAGYEFWGPHNGEKLLTEMYGDFMKLPSIEKRERHYSTVEFLDIT